MRRHRITTGGQVSLPSEVRRRWGTRTVVFEDRGDHLVVRPIPDDPVAAARGALAGRIPPSDELRTRARADEESAERRRRA